jgi:hypothetical protein
MHVSLFGGRSFIGRTYSGKQLEIDPHSLKLKHKGNSDVDWFVLNTKLIDPLVRPIIEFSILIKQTEKKFGALKAEAAYDATRVGLGFMMVPLFEGAAQANMMV